MTWPEVTDTAVKIGLPTTLTALTAIFLAKFSHSHDLEKERRKRKQDFLEKLGSDFDAYDSALDAMRSDDQVARRLPDSLEAQRSLLNTYRAVDQAERGLSHLQSRLLMSGFPACYARLQEYEMATTLLKAAVSKQVGEDIEQSIIREVVAVSDSADAFRESLRDAYQGL